jgi:DNA-directed RNA polymerase specialized sigma24 family protein
MAHYVNNADFLAAIVEMREKVKYAKENNLPEPQVSNYIGECILKIATHLSYKPNFINYSYREEMISDGIENCLQYINNFDPAKSNNPFAYFTQIIYYAFLRRIAKEKKQSYIKGKLIQDMPFEAFELQEQDETGEFHNAYLDFMQNNNTFDDFIDRKKEKAAKKKMENTLNAFIDEVTDEQSYTRSIEEIGVEGFDSDSISSVSTSSDEKPKKKRK